MAILPTAHASQRFGGKTIDFYVAPGQVIGSDPRARADERRIQDLDGERHPVRIGKRDFSLDPGDYAAVIRLQPGPKRRSRPVAVINYRTGTWTRTHDDTPKLLSRAGVARNTNWLLAVLALAGVAALIVWPQLVAMLSIFAPGLASGLPVFDMLALMAAAQPGLADARLAEMAPALADLLTNALPQLAGFEGAAIFALGVTGGLLVAFGARSWRFAWMPVFLVGVLAGSIAIAGPEAALLPALLALGGSALFFLFGGLINRWRDSARLEARVARLADHVLRHPPEEMVTRREPAPALSDADVSVSETSDVAEPADSAPVAPAAAVAGVAAIGAAAISARSTDEAEGAEAEIAGADAEAVSADVSGEAEAASAEAPAEEVSEASAEPETAEAVQAVSDDPRHEARSMDIPPPPPMPVSAPDEVPVNRDADGEADEATGGSTLISDQAGEPAALAGEESADISEPSAPENHTDEIAAAADAFGGGEQERRE